MKRYSLSWGMFFFCALGIGSTVWSQVVTPQATQTAKEMKIQDQITEKDALDARRPGAFCKTFNYSMEAGKVYRIDMIAQSSGFDPFLRLEDPKGKELTQDDDGGGFPNARIFHKAAAPGNYKIICTTFTQGMKGKFSLNVIPSSEAEMKQATVRVPIQTPPKELFKNVPTTHKQIKEVTVRGSDGKEGLQTVGIDSEGRVLALTASPKSFTAPVKGATSEVHVFSPEGNKIDTWKVNFHANFVTGGPRGVVYVAGDGKVAQFDKQGKLLATIDLPHLQAAVKDAGSLRQQAENELKQQRENYQKIIKNFSERLKTIENKKEDDRTPLEKNQLTALKQTLKTYEQMEKQINARSVDDIVEQKTGRLRTINSLAVSSKDVFFACGAMKGYGYAIWRVDPDFKNPKQVIESVMGCCGQMDIHCCGEDLLVAENCNRRFARYDRDGKLIGAWGKQYTEKNLEGFGGCCNPMNVRGVANGDVFTAESEGIIKRFSPKGDFKGVVGCPAMTGFGCKNVAFAVSQDENRVYFLDLPGSRFLILSKSQGTPASKTE